MKKYHFNILINDFKTNAGSKAVSDCKELLLARSYVDLDIRFIKNPLLLGVNILKLLFRLSSHYLSVEPGSLIIVQYPLKGVNRYFRHFIRLMKSKGCSFIAIVHDLDSLRYKKPESAVREEISGLDAYDVVIAHNDRMIHWLREKGMKARAVNLMIFDYLFDEDNQERRVEDFASGSRNIVFAGSLGRGEFIFGLKELGEDLSFRLYGPNLSSSTLENSRGVTWEGSFSAGELVRKLKGEFGLIWDGDSLHSCEGPVGDYISYNNPHKLSLYLAAGLPVIVPSKAALADWVREEGLGITVDSLFELSERISKISKEEYARMVANASVVSRKLKCGFYFSTALGSAEEYIHSRNAEKSTELSDKTS